MYILEWSKSQNARHIDLLEKSIERNLGAFVGDKKSDWIPVFIGSKEGCEVVAAKMVRQLGDREVALMNLD